MKTCPVCKARLFEDMDTCYGCMHRFDEDEPMHEEIEEPKSPVRPRFDEKERAALQALDAQKVSACEGAASESQLLDGALSNGAMPDRDALSGAMSAGAAPDSAPSPKPSVGVVPGLPSGWTVRLELTDRTGAERVPLACVLTVDLAPGLLSCPMPAGQPCPAACREQG